jgi:hypothetical protein
MEFLKNRQITLLNALGSVSTDVSAAIPAVVADKDLGTAMSKLKTDAKNNASKLKSRVEAPRKDPKTNDPVFNILAKIFSSDANHALTRDMAERHQINKRAWRRFVVGYPPRKANDTSVGDALNWEWLIYCGQVLQLQGRFMIVTRDNDYSYEFANKYYLNDHLKRDFRDRVGKKSIVFTKKPSDALKALEVTVSKAEIEAEESLDHPSVSLQESENTLSTLIERLTAGLDQRLCVRVQQEQLDAALGKLRDKDA